MKYLNRLRLTQSLRSSRKPTSPQPPTAEIKPVISCPYCSSTDLVKKGKRKKKYETVQLYFCRRCQRKFTPLINKRRKFPLKVIIDSITLYNRFHSMDKAAEIASGTYGILIRSQNISNWLKDFKEHFPVLRLRSKIQNQYDTRRIFIDSRLFHGQIYDFKCHYAKLDLLINNHTGHNEFQPLKEFLEAVPSDCPHQLFRQSAKTKNRSSKHKDIFNIDQLKITPRQNNTAVKNARFALQSVANNKLRHETLQEFMLTNDSVTVAVEVPVLLDKDDIDHFQTELGFEVPLELKSKEVITGHIDIIQIRNGKIHILDYKPRAKKEKPVDQLAIYALALSRLTGLKLYHFKCAWFDDSDYFEFYPLQVVHKRTT